MALIRLTCARNTGMQVLYKAEVDKKVCSIQKYLDLSYLPSQGKTVVSICDCCVWCKPYHCTYTAVCICELHACETTTYLRVQLG